MKPDLNKPIDLLGLALFHTFWVVIIIFSGYQTYEMATEGEIFKAQVIRNLPNEASSTNKAKNAAKFANRHILEIDGKQHEIALQSIYKPQNLNIKWIPKTDYAVVTNAKGEYNWQDLLGSNNDVYIAGLSLLFVIAYPFHLIWLVQKYRKLKKLS